VVVVDVRQTAAYNGWKLEGEARGGHIRGAVSFPMSWTERITEAKLRLLLAAKGLTADKTLILYDVKGDQSSAMAQLLGELGYERVLTYDAGLAARAADRDLPMARLANYEKLVYPEWVLRLVQGEHPETYPGKGFVVFEVGWNARNEYDQGHIPGAAYLDTTSIEQEPLWNRVSDEDLEAALLAHGVAYDTTVVLYGREPAAAARAASVLMYAGVEDVRLLDGGFDAWLSADYEVGTEKHAPVSASTFGREIPTHPEYIIDTKEARAILADENAELISIRSWAEYIGETSGYGFIEPKGRIAGALWGHAGLEPHSMKYLRNVDDTMRSYHEVAANWRDRGITPDKKISFYCGTGWRASEAFFYAYLMGWERISVYDGGWHEWSADPSNLVESGEPSRTLTVSLPRALLLDLDDTIVDFSRGADPCWRGICERFAPRIEGVTAEELFAAIKERRAWFWADPVRHRRGRLHIDEARREIVAAALAQLGVAAPALAREIADTYVSERERTVQPFPGAIGALRHLRDQGVRLALITSGNGAIQRQKIERFGLAHLFDCILIEGEFGIGKPDERIYLYALDELGAEPEETWMAGDNLEWDVGAPQALGITGIWVDFAGQGLPEGTPVHPDRIIRSLTELVQGQAGAPCEAAR
jgi:HAD superfamily hydrolase (TIGR01509 family)